MGIHSGNRTAGNTSPTPGYDSKNVSFLLDTSNADNLDATTTFVDSSANDFVITRSGDVVQSARTPFVPEGYWSNSFDGTGDFLSVAYNSALNILSGDFTIECWFYHTSTQYDVIASSWGQGGLNVSDGWVISISANNQIELGWAAFSTAASFIVTANNVVQTNAWHHVAVTRSGNNFTIWLNGVNVGTGTNSGTNTATHKIDIGFYGNGSLSVSPISYFNGHISNLRIVKGTALYTTNFTPPTAPLTAISGTSLLTCQSNRFKDNSGNNFTITRNGDVEVSTQIPFTTFRSYNSGIGGGSAVLDGTGDYFSVANATAFDFGSGDFTLECWAYSAGAHNGVFFGKRANTVSAYSPFQLGVSNSVPAMLFSFTGFSWGINSSSSVSMQPGAWNHIAMTRSGSTFTLWVNGQSGVTASNASALMTNTTAVTIGTAAADGTGAYTGSMAGVRIVKGTALYTVPFTPPTAPPTVVSGTSLLLGYDEENNTYIDSSTNNFAVTRFGDTSQNAVSPYIPNGYWSNSFDGTGDFLTLPNNSAFNLGNGEFTIECWVNPTVVDGSIYRAQIANNGTNAQGLGLLPTGVANFFGYNGGGSVVDISSAPGSIVANRWTHIAVVRSSNVTQIYVNGVASGTPSTTNYTIGNIPQNPYIGIYQTGAPSYPFNGRISNFRFVRGSALYTTNFTPPTAPLTAVTGTSLLTCQSNRFIDNSPNNFAITRSGDVTISNIQPFANSSAYSALTNYTYYTPGMYGGSAFFDGSGDTLQIPSSVNLTFATGDFTIEAFVYINTNATDSMIMGNGLWAANKWALQTNSNQVAYQNKFTLWVNNFSTGVPILTGTSNVVLRTWYHVAVTRRGNVFRLFVNGVEEASVTNAVSIDGGVSSALYISSDGTTSSTFVNGYITNLRVLKGTALYTANFTPQTTPLTAVTNTSLLLNFNNLRTGQNLTFKDYSPNNFAITRNGDVSYSGFNPYTPDGYWSTYFDGNGDYLSAPGNSAWVFAGDFTMECWFTITGESPLDANNQRPFVLFRNGTQGFIAFQFMVGGNSTTTGTGLGIFRSNDINSGISYTFSKNVWYHVALVRRNNVCTYYVNGVAQGTPTTISGSIGSVSYTMEVGGSAQSSYSNTLMGYMTNVRIVNGTAIYTSNFTPSTTPLTPVTNTSVLICSSNRFRDRSTNNLSFTRNGDARTVQFSPFSTPANSSVTTYGGSAFFDGSGDYLSSSATNVSNFGTGNFTFECWIYRTAINTDQCIYDGRPTSGNGTYFTATILGSTNKLVVINNGATAYTTTAVIPSGSWLHIAIVRTGTGTNQSQVYINGALDGSYTDATNYINALNTIGAVAFTPLGGASFNGYISNLRILKGVALYRAAFTPPTLPFTTNRSDPSDVYANYTSFYLTTNDVNSAQNNTFLDSSTNAFSITRNGNTTQGTFSPFSQTGWSNYFDGTGDYLNLGGQSAFAFGTNDFTVEMWVLPQVTSAQAILYGSNPSTTDGAYLTIGFDASAKLFVYVSAAIRIQGTATVPANQWTHVAVSRSGTSTKLFINGVQDGSTWTDTTSYLNGANRPVIGTNPYTVNTNNLTGYISNARVVNGTAVYTANFTPPTSPLTAITNTSLLTCQSNRFIDNSSNAFAITRNGDVSVQAFSPFAPTAAWSASTNGGSGYFDGTGDYLSVADNVALDLGASDFTIELWAYYLAVGGASGRGTIAKGTATGASFLIFQGASNELSFYASSTGTTWDIASAVQFSNNIPLNTWHHIAVTRSGTTFRLFLNGTQTNTFTSSASLIDNASAVDIGAYGSLAANAYFSNIRIVKGTAVYTANFTPPTAPLTAITNTSLLLNFTNAGIYDSASGNDLETVGNAQVSTVQSRTGASSIAFDGTGDWLVVPNRQALRLGAANFTIELWYYPTNVTGVRQIFNTSSGPFGAANNSYALITNGTSLLYYLSSTGTSWDIASGVSGGTVALNTWHHIALVRNGSTFNVYLNGTAGTSTTSSASLFAFTSPLGIGSDLGGSPTPIIGYIGDLRITNGIARYTSNFVPQVRYTEYDYVSALLKFEEANIYDASNNTAVTTVGDARVTTAKTRTGNTSVYFDGTGDYLTIRDTQSLVLGTGEFTIEFWINFSDVTTNQTIFDARPLSVNGLYPAIYIQSGTIRYYVSAVDVITSASVVTGTWYHVSLVRANNITSLYINGAISGSPYADANNYLASSICTIGASSFHLNGTGQGKFFIQDFRVTRGTARYGKFTTPTAELLPVQNTALLLKTSSTNALQNATFVDSSPNNFTVTRNGAATQTSFNPHTPSGYWSASFDKNGDYITIPDNAAFRLGTGSFTVEAWIYPTSVSATFSQIIVGNHYYSGAVLDRGWGLALSPAGRLTFFTFGSTGSSDQVTELGTRVVNQWVHVAAVRNNGVLTLYIDGVPSGSISSSKNEDWSGANATLKIGTDEATTLAPAIGNSTASFGGYISNVRVIKGSAAYTSNFTPPTAPLSPTADTSLLCLQDNRFKDNSSNNFTMSKFGETACTAFTPFTPRTYSITSHGASGFFAGNSTSDYLTLPANAAFAMGTGDFTIDFWFYSNNFFYNAGFGDTYGPFYTYSISGTNYFNIWAGTPADRRISFNYGTSGGGSYVYSSSTWTQHQWNHVAVVRRNNIVTVYLNGVGGTPTSVTQDFSVTTYTPAIGRYSFSDAGGFFGGYLSNFRIVKGTALYDSNFAPQASPGSNVAGTSLLLNFANAGVFDAANVNKFSLNDGAQVSTTAPRYGSSSMYFDGSSDAVYLETNPALDFQTNPYTIEFWMKTNGAQDPFSVIISKISVLEVGNAAAAGKLTYGISGQTSLTSITTVNNGNWHHVALQRNGARGEMYINGVLEAYITTWSTGAVASLSNSRIGRWQGNDQTDNNYTGWIQDFRVVNGRNVYVSNFTPPSRSLTNLIGS